MVRIERELTHLVRRAQRVQLHTDGPVEPLERSAYTILGFLNDEGNRSLLRGVISAGNSNFGEAFCLAGDIISRKCSVPHLYRIEVFGTPEDVERVTEGLELWWK